ncbi:hypothetical protein [Cyanobacterium aponinum]|uniref:Uncharacterized protein n=1 Tax=Cyanobacterium aponinum 0216 TaxID=2676140 RepID=A0A844GW81_9CHRO|nr:hypothetical protein [Cyanobacterium aponinum]MTF38266.1 hypothetical protein [Cyanobacterium aponinum 0216]
MKNSKEELLNLWLWVNKINKNNLEKGNTLIVAIGIGLVLIIATSLALFNSSKDKTNVQAGESTKKTVAVGELGITRIHDFLSRNSRMAMYNKVDWETKISSGEISTTDDKTVTNDATGNATCGTVTAGTTASDPIQVSDITDIEKQAVNNNNFTQGGFILSQYTATPDSSTIIAATTDSTIPPNTVIGTGLLTIDADLNPSATDLNSIFTGNNTSKTRIQVEIPILKKDPNSIPYPGVWLSDQTSGSWSNNVDADIMISAEDCDNLQLAVEEGRSFIISSAKFPNMPTFPTVGNLGVYSLGNLKGKDVAITLPRTVANSSTIKGANAVTTDDVPDSKGIFHYIVDDLSANGGSTMVITPGKKVYLYLKGEFYMGGTSSVDHTFSCVDPDPLSYACLQEKKLAGFAPENFRIYGYGYNKNESMPYALNGQTDGTQYTSDPAICLKGSGNTEGFIFAPGYQGAVSGGGSNDAFVGTVWIERWAESGGKCGSNTSNTVITQDTSDWSSIGLVPQGLAPQIGTTGSWQRKNR